MTTEEKLRIYARRAVAGGPDRVMISEGEAVSCRRARDEFGIEPDIVFIRDDGWALGAPSILVVEAEETWNNEWIGVLVRPASEPMSYQEWRRNR